MAITPSASTSANATTGTSSSGSMLDVAGIVSGLMQIENKPLDALSAKIEASKIKVSLLGQFQSKLSAVQIALQDLQNKANFGGTVTTSDATVATASTSGDMQPGRYTLQVSKTAEVALTNISGFNSSTAPLTGTSYSFAINGTTYAPEEADNVTTLTELRDWINTKSTLKNKVQASIVEASTNQFVLSLRGLATGSDNALETRIGSQEVAPYQQAQDAVFSINGIQFTRSSNIVADAVVGMELNLIKGSGASTVTLQVSNSDNTNEKKLLGTLVKSYNDLLDFYKTQTAPSAELATRGILNGDFSVQNVMRQLQIALANPLTDASGLRLKNPADSTSTTPQYIDLLGLEFSTDGRLALSDTLMGRSTQLQAVLGSGIKIGFDTNSLKDLSQTITSMLDISGLVYERVQSENQLQRDMAQKKNDLQDRLARVQQQYFVQYAALDALLFKLNSTSTSLKSAFDSLSASQNSK